MTSLSGQVGGAEDERGGREKFETLVGCQAAECCCGGVGCGGSGRADVVERLAGVDDKRALVAHALKPAAHLHGVEQLLELSGHDDIAFHRLARGTPVGGVADVFRTQRKGIGADCEHRHRGVATYARIDGRVYATRRVTLCHGSLIGGAVVCLGGATRGESPGQRDGGYDARKESSHSLGVCLGGVL